jgi:hypothetical protein
MYVLTKSPDGTSRRWFLSTASPPTSKQRPGSSGNLPFHCPTGGIDTKTKGTLCLPAARMHACSVRKGQSKKQGKRNSQMPRVGVVPFRFPPLRTRHSSLDQRPPNSPLGRPGRPGRDPLPRSNDTAAREQKQTRRPRSDCTHPRRRDERRGRLGASPLRLQDRFHCVAG